jgi:hypothetical protein
MELEVSYRAGNVPPLLFIVNQLKPAQTLVSYLRKVHFDVILILALKSLQ